MPGYRNKHEPRNVHFLDGKDDEILGFMQTGFVTWDEMEEWLEIVIAMPSTSYSVWTCIDDRISEHGSRILLTGNTSIIEPGFYAILSPRGDAMQIDITEEKALPRPISPAISTDADSRLITFQERVRSRDMCCVISQEPVFHHVFIGFHATHIFPLAHLDLWRSENWASHLSDDEIPGSTGIHSIQNGILLDLTLHTLFCKYFIAINPDNNYKITYFYRRARSPGNGETMYLNPAYPEKHQPSHVLLKHHFRMTVICNMTGRGPEYDWDEDITPGMDQVSEISGSDQGKTRFELEVASRLNVLDS